MEGGGAERVAATLANAWAKREDDVTLVVTFSRRGGCAYRLDDRVRMVYLADGLGRGPWSKSRAVRLWRLRRLVVEKAPAVIVSMLTNVNVAAILATRGLKSKVPVCVCERVHPLADEELGRAWRGLRRLTYRAADVVVTQTAEAGGALRRCTRVSRVAVVPNPLPVELEAREIQIGDRAPRRKVVGMGRLERQKGFDRLVTVFARVASEFPEWDLWIFGEGSQRSMLEAVVRRLNLEGRVLLPGWAADPWSELEKADLFVLPSRWEGFPNALLEAMALGVACIAYDCPAGPGEITRRGQDGVLLPAGDEHALETALRALMSDEAKRRELGGRGAKSVRERYALSRVLTLWDEVFRSVGALGT